MRLNKIDLNLFLVFDAIYTERNLTRAAVVLSITQPAVSNALTRLRNSLNDQLFVRTPQGMVPTPVADNIVGQVREALQLLNVSVHEGDVFDPAVAEKVFHFSMNDFGESVILPPLLEYLQLHSPGIGLTSYYEDRADVPKALASGQLDFAIDIPLVDAPNLCHVPIKRVPYVCVVRQDHPEIGDSLSLEQYLNLKHIMISSRRSGAGYVDMGLERLGHKRDIRLRVKHYMVAPQILERSNLALTVPLSEAQDSGLKILKLPFNVEPLVWHLYWHKSADNDQSNRWLRQVVKDLMAD